MKKDKVQSVEHLCLFETKAISPGNEMQYNYVSDCKNCQELFWKKVVNLFSARPGTS